MHERPRPARLGGARDGVGAKGVNGLKTLPAGLALDAAGVDHDLRAFHRSLDGSGIPHIRLHRLDLANDAVGHHEMSEIGTPHRDPHPPAGLGESARDIAADEARAAEDSRQTIAARGIIDHAFLPGGSWKSALP